MVPPGGGARTHQGADEAFVILGGTTQVVAWKRRAAEQGDSFQQSLLGDAYAYGRNVSQDDAEAVRWASLGGGARRVDGAAGPSGDVCGGVSRPVR